MSKVIIDLEIFKDVLKTYFSSYFASQLLDTMNDNEVFIANCNPEDSSPWIPVDESLPGDFDIYEVTAVTEIGCNSTYLSFAHYNSITKEWLDDFTGFSLNVLAWKPCTELFTVPFI